MADVRPFRAVRPRQDLAHEVIAPPYDVLDEDEARAIASAHPHSFLYVTRPEVGMPPGTLPAQRVVWERGRDNLRRMIQEGVLQRDETASYYLYGQRTAQHAQLGLLAAVSVDEYDQGAIRKHEYTLPEKEDDRTRHLEVLDAQVGLVFLTYASQPNLSACMARIATMQPQWRVQTDDGVEHTMWVVPQAENQLIQEAFRQVPVLYVADGHHRSAAASRVHAHRQDAASAHFLAGLFPDDQLQVLAYHRVVEDLGAYDAAQLVAAIRDAGFEVVPGTPLPAERGSFAMYVQGVWYVVRPEPGVIQSLDPVARLDTAILQEHILAPILHIIDPRASTRIRFVGGHRGPDTLEAIADATGGVAFHLYPTGLDQLFEVADAGEVMPAKSTWFEPKLREGVVIRLLDEA